MASDKKIDTEATLTKLAPPWSHKLDPTNERLAIPYVVRLPTATGASGLCGFALGMTDASSMAALRYRAENAHRLPKTTRGWYFYHKSKNYYVLSAGAREGLKKGGMMSFWVAGFVTVEDVIDSARGGRRDFLSTVVAGLTTAGFWSAWNRFDLPEAARTARLGLVVGIGYGLLQDSLSYARGRRIGYIEYIKYLFGNTEITS